MEIPVTFMYLLNLILILPLCNAQADLAALLGLTGFGDFSESQMSGSGACPYQAHPDRTKFSQIVNNRLMTQDCAPGTMFVLSKCSCDNIPAGATAGRPMPGSNPRLESTIRGGNNPMLENLLRQLQGGGGPPMMSNQISRMPQVTSGIRPDQQVSGIAINVQKEHPSPDRGIQYNPNPSTTGLTSVVDPSVLPDVLSPEILRILERSNLSPENKIQSQSSPRSNGASISGSSALPPDVQRMLDRSSAPPKETSPPIIPPVGVAQGGKPSPPGSLPPDVLSMLQRAMQPPSPRGTIQSASNNAEKQPQPSPKTPSRSKAPTPQRAPSPTGNPSAGPDPMADLMAQLSRAQGSQTPQTMNPQSGPREDPLAALLAGLRAPPDMSSRDSARGSSRSSQQREPSQSPQRGPSSGISGAAGGDPLAALLAGLTGGQSGSGALMAGMGGSMPGGSPFGATGSADISSLLAGLGARSGSPSAPGGPLDVNTLSGNVNVATLLGETPGPSLGANMDMTALFNAQGQMGVGGGLAGLNNLNLVKLQQLDRQGIIDLSDLTPAGLAAANAHFNG